MTYGTRVFKNGKRVGYLLFDSGKRVFLNSRELFDFDAKLFDIENTGRLKERENKLDK
jgi:hypothetical protein